MILLGDLSPGDEARVDDVRCAPSVRRRLLEMGLLPGTVVRVVRRAPLGDPIEVRLRGYSLSLRGTEAALVEVTRLPQTARDRVPAASPLPAE